MTATKLAARHPVRAAFAGRSSGNGQGTYYSTKGHAVNAFDAELQTFDLCLSRDEIVDYSGNEGRATVPVCDEFGNEVGCAVFSWYRMPSGNYEFIGYLA